MSNGDGLKGQWGVKDPAQAPSDKQAQEFQSAFQAAIAAIGGHLQYTSANAEAAKHDPLAARRDALYAAFQATLPQIDPSNPDKAKGAIAKVLGDANALNGETAQFHQEAEKAKNDWDARQPQYDEAVKHVEELEAWEDPKAPPLRGLADGIRTQTNDRKYAQASKTFDALLPKLEPIYAEYLKQKAAKEQYDPALAALQPRLTAASTSEHVKLKPKQEEIAAAQKEMEASAQIKDYVKALTQVGDLASKVESYEQALAELEKQKKAYEDALAALEPKLTQAAQSTFKKLEPKQQELAAAKPPIEANAQKEEYEQALQQVNDLATKADAYLAEVEELQKQKKAYEDAWAPLQPKFDQTTQETFKKLAPLQQELTTLKGQIDAAVEAEDFVKALQQVNDLATKVDAYLAEVEKLQQQKKAYEDALAALQPKLDQAGQSSFKKLEPKQQELTTGKDQAATTAQNEDFEQALKQVNDLSTKVDAYLTEVEKLQQQKKAYEDALAALQPKLDQAEQSTFKKLEPTKQDLTAVKGHAEATAQAEDYEPALKEVNDLATKVDAYLAEVEKLQQQKKAYEDALAALQPKLDQAEQSTFKKLEPTKQDLTAVKGHAEATAQAEDYEPALKEVNDLATKVDAYLAEVEKLQQQKKAYEDALAALQPKLDQAEQSTFKKLEPTKQDLTAVKGHAEATAQAEDYEPALKEVNDLATKVDAYLAEVEKLQQQKKAYEDALAALQPKLDQAEQSTFKKLEPTKQDLTAAKEQAAATAQNEDFEQALQQVNDLSTKVDAYLAEVEKLQQQKKAYEDALAALQPKLDQAGQSSFKKLEPKQQELTAAKEQAAATAQNEDFEQALQQVNDLSTKVDAYLAEVEKLQQQKKAYEDALTALQTKLDQAGQSSFKKLEPKQQELTAAKEQAAATAQNEDFEQALQQVNDLATKVDAYLAEVEKLQQQKKAYEDAWAALQPKFEQTSQTQFKKLAPQQEELTSLKGQIDAAVQAEDFEQALKQVNDLSTKVDAYLAEVEKLQQQKKAYEDAWAALQPKFEQTSQTQFKKLAPQQEELTSLKGQIDAFVQAEDFEQALKTVEGLSTKVDAYLAAVEETQKQKKAYEDAWAALQPKFEQTAQSQFKKLALLQAELTTLKGQIDPAVQAEDFEQALKLVGDLATKVDAYLAAVEEAQKQKKAYEDAWAALQPKLTEAAQSQSAKLAPQRDELAAAKGPIDAAAQGEDYEQALKLVNDLATKVDTYQAAVEELQKQKKAYEDALAPLQPKVDEAQKTQHAKLAPLQEEIVTVQKKMETAAQSEDYEQALSLTNDLATKLDAYATALEQFEKQKKEYEDALAALQPKLADAQKTPHPKLAPLQEEMVAGQKQMETAAQGEDFEQALSLAKDLSTKVEAYATALEQLEQQKKKYEDAAAVLQPKLAEMASSKSADLVPLQQEITAVQGQMEEAAKKEDYEEALSLVNDLSTKLDAYKNSEAGQVYEITYDGKKYYGTAEELAALRIEITAKTIKVGFEPLKTRAEANEGWYKDLKAVKDDFLIIGAIVNAIGGADLDSIVGPMNAQKPALEAAQQAISTDPNSAEDAFKKAVEAVNATSQAISAYMDALDKGGNRTITALQVVEVGCFAIGAAAGAAILAPAGAGLLATAGANAAAGAGFGALQSLAENGAHNLIMTGEKPISPGEIVTNAALAAVTNGVGAALGSVASKQVGALVVEKIVAKYAFKQAVTKLIVKDIVEGSLGNTVQTAVAGAPDLIRGKTTWDKFAVAVAEAFVAGGIAGAIAGKMNRNSPLFKGLKDEEIDAAFKEAKGGTGLELPGQNPKTGEGLQDIKPKFDPNKPIPHHENMQFSGIDGAPQKKVEVRRHSANPNAPEGSFSKENPTTQINTKKKYMLPDGTWKKLEDMTDAEKAAAHIE